MRLGVFSVDEVRVIGGYDLDAVLACQIDQHRIHLLLLHVGLAVGVGVVGLVALKLYVVVVAEGFLEPYHLLLGLVELSGGYQPRNLAAETGRADYQPLAVGGKRGLVGSRVMIEAVCMGL